MNKEYYTVVPHLPVYGDELLGRLGMPVLFLGGERDAIVDADESARRLSRLVPSAESHLLPHCGHVIPNAMEYMGPFLKG